MADCIYELAWRKLTNGLQKYFIILIANMQRPFYYHGFGIANLDLETFTKVKIIAINKNNITYLLRLRYYFSALQNGDYVLYDVKNDLNKVKLATL